MKIVVAGFATALFVFAVATAISETLLTSDTTGSTETIPRRKPSRATTGTESNRTSPKMARTRTADSTAEENAKLQRLLNEERQSTSDLQAKEDALQIALDEIREETYAVNLLKRRVSAELAALQDAAIRVSQREAPSRVDRSASLAMSPSKTTGNIARPTIAVNGGQAAQDMAVLVKRLAKDNGPREAMALLRNLKERDAAKVLSKLSEVDSPLAERLSQDWLVARDLEPIRR